MNQKALKKLINDIKNGKISPGDAFFKLKNLPFEDIGFAKVDHHRYIRKDFPEVVYCQGKTVKQIVEISKKLYKRSKRLLLTRAEKVIFDELKKIFKSAIYHEIARIITIGNFKKKMSAKVLVITAGTADIPVAEEAAVTAEFLGCNVERLFDVGVAGIHRLFRNMKKLHSAKVLIVVAGMEGALASVVSGLVDKPVIAVPTSVGYGASFKGLSALLTMINSCSPGVAVVNIDNGFGAGCFAWTILKNEK